MKPLIIQGEYITTRRLISLGWQRTQIQATFGQPDAIAISEGNKVPIYELQRAQNIVGGKDIYPTLHILYDARKRMENVINDLKTVQVPMGNIDNSLAEELRGLLRTNASRYRGTTENEKMFAVLARLRHQHTFYDEYWVLRFSNHKYAPFVHNAFRMGIHERIANLAPVMNQIVTNTRETMQSELDALLDRICPI